MASIISAGTTISTALNMSGDTSGALQLATNGTTTAITIDANQNATFANTATFTGNVNAPNTFGFKNRLINGAIGIWQRGTSFTSGGSATYTADRFYGNASSGTISRSTDVPAGFTYSFSNAASSTAYPGIAQRIESVNIADCASQAITVSFYVKQTSGTASALNINLAYPTAVDNYASSTTIVETNVVATMPSSWTRYSYTYTLPANVTNGVSVTLFIPSGSVTATFLITGVQLEKGSTATSFDYRPYGTELQLCQRYYENNYSTGYAVGSVSNYPYNNGAFVNGYTSSSGQKFQTAQMLVQKRTAQPTNTYYDCAGNSGKISTLDSGGTQTNNVSPGVTWVSDKYLGAGPSNGTMTGVQYFWTCSAEL